MLIELQKLFDRPEPRVVVLVGSGISFGATGVEHAKWLGLLQHGIDHQVQLGLINSERRNELRQSLDTAFDPFDLDTVLRHAERIAQEFSLPDLRRYKDWLHQSVGSLCATRDRMDSLAAIAELQGAGALIATTNYDSLLCDATGHAPVTWKDIRGLSRVRNRSQKGILHLHGHWSDPDSVILGMNSYTRITNDSKFQQWLRSLWLECQWMFIGCGSGGLEDPNLGMLLKWAGDWPNADRSDIFFAKHTEAAQLRSSVDLPAHLRVFGFETFEELPSLLRQLVPAPAPAPFVRVHDNEFRWFRRPQHSALDIPFPSRAEYLNGDVPCLAVDAEVRNRLDAHGWACVIDRPSTGKTTLALRLATQLRQRSSPVYYIDCSEHTDLGGRAMDALWRLARPGALFIVDNIHHAASEARALWDQWREMGSIGSQLLLIATEVQSMVTLEPGDDLTIWLADPYNPALRINLRPNDMAALLRHTQCLIDSKDAIELAPPTSVLTQWHTQYHSALGAFEFALREHWHLVRNCQWSLPASSAASWFRKRWLAHCSITAGEQANLALLSALGAQDLELDCIAVALPEPGQVERLVEIGLVTRTRRGQHNEFKSYSLSEPSWGEFLLAALDQTDQQDHLLAAAAKRDFFYASLLADAYYRARRTAQHDAIWQRWSQHPQHTLAAWLNLPTLNMWWLVAAERHAPQLAEQVFELTFAKPHEFVRLALRSHLHFVADFLDRASARGWDTKPLWLLLEVDRSKFSELVWRTPLSSIGYCLDRAKAHGHDISKLWGELESDPARFVESAWETPLNFAGDLLDKAKAHGLNTEPLWLAFESNPVRFAEVAWENSLNLAAYFLGKAKAHGRRTELLWLAIESDPDRLTEAAWKTPLNLVATFLDEAKAQGRKHAEFLWLAFESNAARFAEAAWKSPLNLVAGFLGKAKAHGRQTEPLWLAIESDTNRLTEAAWKTPLNLVATFLDEAKAQRRKHTEILWLALESDPARLTELAWKSPPNFIADFLIKATAHGRKTELLWLSFESDPSRLAEWIVRGSLGDASVFIQCAQAQGRKLTQFWSTLESEPTRFVNAARRASLHLVADFLSKAKAQGRNPGPLWASLQSDPNRLTEWITRTPLGELALFLQNAQRSDLNLETFWSALESDPAHFARIA